MNNSHSQALRTFARRLEWLLVLRSALHITTVWFFVWGVVVLAFKVAGIRATEWLPVGVLGFVPLLIFAAWREHRRQPALTVLRANYDRLNQCGGLLMAGEVADMRGWEARLPAASVPPLHWHYGRTVGMLGLSLVFLATALWLPERLANLAARHSLEIGPIVEQLQAEVQFLKQENIVEDKKAAEVQKQLSQLKQDSSAVDPDKTWEALDHIKESDTAAAKQAAEEAVAKTTALSEAETIGLAMEQAAGAGLGESTASQAAQNLSALLKSANLETGMLQARIPPDLLSNLNGLSKQDLDNLIKALEANKGSLSDTLAKLSAHRLIDPKLLAQCRNAGQCQNPGALADFLSSCTNGSCSLAECLSLCQGGLGRGGPGAPLTWSDGSSEADVKFQEHVLPPDSQLSGAMLVGVSRTAPQLNSDNPVPANGALDTTAGSGGSANARVILPEHREAVRDFFKREP